MAAEQGLEVHNRLGPKRNGIIKYFDQIDQSSFSIEREKSAQHLLCCHAKIVHPRKLQPLSGPFPQYSSLGPQLFSFEGRNNIAPRIVWC